MRQQHAHVSLARANCTKQFKGRTHRKHSSEMIPHKPIQIFDRRPEWFAVEQGEDMHV